MINSRCMKKKNFAFTVFISLIVPIIFAGISACSSSKTGCPANEKAHVKADKRGNLPTSRGKSSVFPKDVKKKLGVK